MSFMGVVYRLIGRRFSTLLVTGAGAAFAFDMTFNRMTNAYWDYRNKGKQWKDIKDTIVYSVEAAEDEAAADASTEEENGGGGGNGGNGGGDENGGSEEA